MLDTAFYLVTEQICRRAGLLGQRYRTKDGRYILDNKDLSRVRFTSDEYVSGLSGVEKISLDQARTLIAGGGHSMEVPEAAVAETETTTENPEPQTEEPEPEPESTAEETVEETPAKETAEEQPTGEQITEEQGEEPAPEAEEQPSAEDEQPEETDSVSEESENKTE